MTTPRYLMAEADSGAGSNTAGTGTDAAAPTESQAQGSQQAVDVGSIVEQVKNSLFAELRRTGVLGEKKQKTQTDTPQGKSQDINPLQFRELDRAVGDRKLGPDAWKRLERDFVSEKPENVTEWVKGYFDAFGIAQPQQQQQQATTTQTRNGPTTSDRGGVAQTRQPLDEVDILSLSPDDIAKLVKEKGNRWYSQQLTKQLSGRKFSVRK